MEAALKELAPLQKDMMFKALQAIQLRLLRLKADTPIGPSFPSPIFVISLIIVFDRF